MFNNFIPFFRPVSPTSIDWIIETIWLSKRIVSIIIIIIVTIFDIMKVQIDKLHVLEIALH